MKAETDVPKIVVSKVANEANFKTGFKCAIGVDAPTNVVEAVTSMNKPAADSMVGTPKA